LYSANWDHYEDIKFWDAVDQIGLTAYYRLTESYEPKLSELVAAWAKIRAQVLAWQKTVNKPLVLTEVGYPSLDGAARSPWDYTTGKAMDLEEQRLCFEAFRLTWQDVPELHGVYFWNWWGPTDGKNTWYTPHGKPAMGEIMKWLKNRRQNRTKK
jgi:hypothetical protein